MPANTLTIEDLRFALRLSPRRRSVGITIERDGGLTVSAPAEATLARVEAAVRSRLFWVYQKLSLRRRPSAGSEPAHMSVARPMPI